MRVIDVRNVHEALPRAIYLLNTYGKRRDSRNGVVLQSPEPVTTVYHKPCERVLFWPERDANPFFHLFEGLWMLAGRRDVESVARYAKNMRNFSDDGQTFNGAYGYRWRHWFAGGQHNFEGDQIAIVTARLKADPDDRRCVIAMWDGSEDLGNPSKDVPCNVTATVQVNTDGKVDLTVFCRSNDIIWGAYGANAVHFSMLQEYIACALGREVGTLTQVSVNWHGYLKTFEPLIPLGEISDTENGKNREDKKNIPNPYNYVRPEKMFHRDVSEADLRIAELLMHAQMEFNNVESVWNDDEPFFVVARLMLMAHNEYKRTEGIRKFDAATRILLLGPKMNDWLQAGREWIERRKVAWEAKQ